MRKIKILATSFLTILLMASCGEYQKVLNKGTTQDQYKMAVKKYEAKVNIDPVAVAQPQNKVF